MRLFLLGLLVLSLPGSLTLTACDLNEKPVPCVRQLGDGGCDVYMTARACGYTCPRDFKEVEDAGSCPLSELQCK